MVYDRVKLVSSSTSKEWHLQSLNPITVSGRSYKFDNGQYRLWGQSLLPASGVTLTMENINEGDNNALSSRRLNVIVKDNQATDYLLNVLQLAPVTQGSMPTPQLVQASTGNMDGILCNGWAVLAGRNEPVNKPVVYTLNTSAATQHLVVDLGGSTVYQIKQDNLSSGASSTVTQTTSARGSLRFSTPAGNFRITLIPASSGKLNLAGCVNLVQQINFTFRPTDGSAPFTRTVTLKADGSFTLTGIPAKRYDLAIKGAKWLQKVVPVDATGGYVIGVTATLRPGDINDDNVVDIADLSDLADAFFTTPGDPFWNAQADLNCDNRVDIKDLGLLAAAFGVEGDP
jgi:hypothetical protein